MSPTIFHTEIPEGVAIGSPGLWKHNGSGQASFYLPSHLMSGLDTAPGEIAQWAAATRPGGPGPKDWAPPEEACALVEPDTLHIREHEIYRQIQLHTNYQFSIQVNLTHIPATLTQNRKRWLAVVLDSAAATWTLPRFGLSGDARTAIAEINLSGAPPQVLKSLIPPSIATFRWVVRGLTPILEFITSEEYPSGVVDSLNPYLRECQDNQVNQP